MTSVRLSRVGLVLGALIAGLTFGSPLVATAATQAQIVNCAGASGCFSPLSITIPAGTTVTWTNNSSLPHTATSDSGAWTAGTVASPINSGSAASTTFSTAGTFTYHCAIHPSMAHGTVVVTLVAATPTPTPSATAPPVRHLASGGGGPATSLPSALALLAGALLLGFGLLIIVLPNRR